jgi:hypothetical protein
MKIKTVAAVTGVALTALVLSTGVAQAKEGPDTGATTTTGGPRLLTH